MDSLSLENSGCIPATRQYGPPEKGELALQRTGVKSCHPPPGRKKRMQLLGDFADVVEYFLSEGNSPSTWPEIPIVSSFYTLPASY